MGAKALEIIERLTCTADEATGLDLSFYGKEHPIRKGYQTSGYVLSKVDWRDNAATVDVTYTLSDPQANTPNPDPKEAKKGLCFAVGAFYMGIIYLLTIAMTEMFLYMRGYPRMGAKAPNPAPKGPKPPASPAPPPPRRTFVPPPTGAACLIVPRPPEHAWRTFRVAHGGTGGLYRILGREHPRERWKGYHADQITVSNEWTHAKVVVRYSRGES